MDASITCIALPSCSAGLRHGPQACGQGGSGLIATEDPVVAGAGDRFMEVGADGGSDLAGVADRDRL
ncbi:MAG: hypothetical protein WAL26_16055, partial [Mycobacterium sp.]